MGWLFLIIIFWEAIMGGLEFHDNGGRGLGKGKASNGIRFFLNVGDDPARSYENYIICVFLSKVNVMRSHCSFLNNNNKIS